MRRLALAAALGLGGCFSGGAGADAPSPDGTVVADVDAPGADAAAGRDAGPDASPFARCGASTVGSLATEFLAIPDWATPFDAPTVTMTANGRLAFDIQPSPALEAYAGIDAFALDLTNRRITIEIVEGPENPDEPVELGLALQSGGGEAFFVWIEGGQISTRQAESGPATTERTWQPIAHRFIGFRERSGMLLVSASSDGRTFIDLDSEPTPPWATAATLDLFAGSFGLASAPQRIQIEQLDDCID